MCINRYVIMVYIFGRDTIAWLFDGHRLILQCRILSMKSTRRNSLCTDNWFDFMFAWFEIAVYKFASKIKFPLLGFFSNLFRLFMKQFCYSVVKFVHGKWIHFH